MFTSVSRGSSVRERSPLPITCWHRQLGFWSACEMRLSRVGGRDDDTCLPELRLLPFPS